jgi:membrane dipeptidase
MRAVCDNPANMPDDILRALPAKGGMVAIHSSAALVSQLYYDWMRKQTVGTGAYSSVRPAVPRAELPVVRSPNHDYCEYIAALDTEMGKLWWFGQRWPEATEAEPLVPTEDEWAAHVEHVVWIAGPTQVAIGLDLTKGRSILKNFDARGYPRLVESLRQRKVSDSVLGENWLRASGPRKGAP